jgi:hypothetical protein
MNILFLRLLNNGTISSKCAPSWHERKVSLTSCLGWMMVYNLCLYQVRSWARANRDINEDDVFVGYRAETTRCCISESCLHTSRYDNLKYHIDTNASEKYIVAIFRAFEKYLSLNIRQRITIWSLADTFIFIHQTGSHKIRVTEKVANMKNFAVSEKNRRKLLTFIAKITHRVSRNLESHRWWMLLFPFY